MLWSDPENEPPKELRDTQAMLRRLGVLMALAMVLAMLVLGRDVSPGHAHEADPRRDTLTA